MMKLIGVIFVMLSLVTGIQLDDPDDPSIRTHPFGTPCATDTKKAWLDIAIVLDVSTTMGAANVKQIGLSLASELSNYAFGTYDQLFTSRVGIITYTSQANVIGDFYQWNNFTEISSALVSLKASTNDSSAKGLTNAMKQALKWIGLDEDGDSSSFREPIVILIAASLKDVNVQVLQNQSQNLNVRNLITVNWNPSDANLTKVLNEIAAPSFNVSKSDKTVYADISWALLQANCFCITAQLSVYDKAKKRIQKYADCYLLNQWDGIEPTRTAMEMCDEGYWNVAITSNIKQIFVEKDDFLGDFGVDSYYTGLHRDENGTWVWYDYDGSTFPLGNFTVWDQGFNASSAGNCTIAHAYAENTPYLWQTSSCYPARTDVMNTVCQSRACDATHMITTNCGGALEKWKTRKEAVKQQKIVHKISD
uniref:C-type lectin n=1 Tax=Acrobeloides nanus TaxID=290746 RepID=A0A914EF55_9BILA